ncbi:hypothetical protein [Enhygromyxa salina]|uniref:hypothetical protein n=1 Tax=Enhygromyxa salina TaxID=215803 RepID=UPI001969E8D0|nr:hypothetical protein [Enhygromyxa salina]
MDNSAMEPGDGSEQSPFTSIALGMAQIGAGNGTLIVAEGMQDYTSSISVNPGQTVAVIGDGGATIDFGGQVVLVNNGAVAFLSGLKIIGGSTGVSVMGGDVWLDQMVVVDNPGSGSLVVTGGTVVARNSLIGGLPNTGAGILLNQGTFSAIYTTIATGFDAPAIQCLSGGAGSIVRNSIVVSRLATPEILGCENAEVTGSALEMSLGENQALGDMSTSWFVSFNSGDFHLNPNMFPQAIETAATWTLADPGVDIDGDPRPTMEGAADFAGADRL